MSFIIAIAMFALSMSISPGPVNMVTLTTGVNHGFWRAMPFVSGATIGFTLLLAAIGLGVSQLVERVPVFLTVLAYLGALFICYMGYKIAVSTPSIELASEQRPNFYQGFLLQWLNPKAWIAGLSCVSGFGLADSYGKLFLCCGIYFLICYASIASWAYLGSRLAGVMVSEARIARFNVVMGVALVLVAVYLLYLQIQGA
jgi:threonine/homoserine/homoserine lactone efflux protein